MYYCTGLSKYMNHLLLIRPDIRPGTSQRLINLGRQLILDHTSKDHEILGHA